MVNTCASPVGSAADQAAPHEDEAAGRRRLGDVQEVATLLNCSTKHVRRLADAGKIPGVFHLGRLVRFDLDLIGRWIDELCPPVQRFTKGNRLGK